MATPEPPRHAAQPQSFWGVAIFLLGVLSVSAALQSILGSQTLAVTVISNGLWQHAVAALGAAVTAVGEPGNATLIAEVPFASLFLPILVLAAVALGAGGWWVARASGTPVSDALTRWAYAGWLWWLLPGVWELVRVTAVLAQADWLSALLEATPALVLGMTLAGWLATGMTLTMGRCPHSEPSGTQQSDRSGSRTRDDRTVPIAVWCAMAIYVVVYVTMNWQLYRGLLVPHGDSAMYEEHLWNLLHGKGFRSYLDQGLFWGEHIQFVHVLLMPLYVLWPSHLLLELCESLALAAGAVPVFWITRRHCGSRGTATALACAYLLYFPMQFLDIAIDLKTFRPISFGIPALLFALDELERRHAGRMLLWLAITLSAKEDFALILAPLGVWMALARPADSGERTKRLGWGLTFFSVAYLFLVVAVVLPWFRGGAEPHYAHYFGELGGTPQEIVRHILTDPLPVIRKLLSLRSWLYVLMLLVPLGLLPLLSPGRLAVALPFFGMLCLLEISPDPSQQGQFLVPYHHFHAPLIPILFWAAAAGLGNLHRARVWPEILRRWLTTDDRRQRLFRFASHIGWTSALASGLFFTLSPLGIPFWDPYSTWHWRKLYVPGRRAELFPRVFRLIPKNARVASTDFIHPRFTHHERSYDYSHYRRKVSGYRLTVPDDTDYIVIDTQHPYSDIKRPDQVRELREHPDQWELLPDTTDGYFIVLKRKRPSPRR